MSGAQHRVYTLAELNALRPAGAVRNPMLPPTCEYVVDLAPPIFQSERESLQYYTAKKMLQAPSQPMHRPSTRPTPPPKRHHPTGAQQQSRALCPPTLLPEDLLQLPFTPQRAAQLLDDWALVIPACPSVCVAQEAGSLAHALADMAVDQPPKKARILQKNARKSFEALQNELKSYLEWEKSDMSSAVEEAAEDPPHSSGSDLCSRNVLLERLLGS
eukprot:GGOE01053724.1.p1 GENE.GGOE01053724.1~~GGOE01053724.1.p1  ORF type:complete len:216 (+),score=40.92 GGOE01053724.1:82-729(+)